MLQLALTPCYRQGQAKMAHQQPNINYQIGEQVASSVSYCGQIIIFFLDKQIVFG